MKRHETRLLAWMVLLIAAALLLTPMHARPTERAVFRTENLRLEIGQQAYLSYLLETDSERPPQFFSDAPLVVGVDQTGLVTAISPGTARITLKAGDRLTARTTVSVYGIPVTELKLDANSLELQKGQRSRLTATTNSGVTDDRVFWSSDDENIVAVTSSGLIEAVGGGITWVRATTVNGLTASARVQVDVPLEMVSLSPAELEVGVGAKLSLTPRLIPADTTERILTWESTNTDVVRVDNQGRISAVGIGQARVNMAMTNGQTAYTDVTVQQTAERIELWPEQAEVARGAEILLSAAIEPEKSLGHYVIWETDSPDVASVQNGVVRGLAAGTARITAIVDGIRSNSCLVTVRIVPEMLRLDVRELTLSTAEAGQPVRLKAEILPADAEDRTVFYASDTPEVAAVDETGIVTLTGEPGRARITAYTESGLTDTCVITIIE